MDKLDEVYNLQYLSIYTYKALCLSVWCPLLFVPGGQTFLTHREGDKHFFHTGERGDKHFSHRGGQTLFVGGGGSYDYVDEEIDVSESSFLVSEANFFC